MKDVELRRAFERLCRKRGLSISTEYLTHPRGRYTRAIEQLFTFFKEGIWYGADLKGDSEVMHG